MGCGRGGGVSSTAARCPGHAPHAAARQKGGGKRTGAAAAMARHHETRRGPGAGPGPSRPGPDCRCAAVPCAAPRAGQPARAHGGRVCGAAWLSAEAARAWQRCRRCRQMLAGAFCLKQNTSGNPCAKSHKFVVPQTYASIAACILKRSAAGSTCMESLVCAHASCARVGRWGPRRLARDSMAPDTTLRICATADTCDANTCCSKAPGSSRSVQYDW